MSDPFAEAALLMADSRYALGREYTAPLDGRTAGRLEIPRGSARLTLRAGAPPAELFRARFGSPMAEVVDTGEAVVVVYRHHGGLRRREEYEGLILLNAAIPWAIQCRGGAAWLSLDMRGLALTSVAISHGVSDVTIDLGEPHDVVPIGVRGGVSHLTIRRPKGVPARVRVSGGTSKLAFDAQYLEAAGGTVILSTPDIDRVTARYEIDVVGGVSHLTVTETDE